MKYKDMYEVDKTFFERFNSFAQRDVAENTNISIDFHQRSLAVLATLIGMQSYDYFKVILPEVIDKGISLIEIKEVVYQATPYLGIGRSYPFLAIVNDFLNENNYDLPLVDQSTTTMDNRLEKGIDCQVRIFGEQMKDYYKASPVNRLLAENCFGDYYTRKGLELKDRELITFCFLLGQGDTASQLKSHLIGNINVGNSVEFMTKLVQQMIPYIGYPRVLNVLKIISDLKK